MHNIHELEKKWLKYKIKSLIPYFIFLLLIIIGLIIFINIDTTSNKPQINTIKVEEIVITPPIVKIIPKIIPKPQVEQIEKKEVIIGKKLILTPSFDFIKKLRNDSTNTYKSNSYVSAKNIETTNEVVQAVSVPKVQEKTKVIEKRKKIKILKQETQADIAHVIKRFGNNNNPALSLFVAKKYYRLGEYDKSYNYALITNELNNNIDESWIVFAKSLVKLNKRDKAIKTLNKYIKFSHSPNAKVLLDDILTGKFK